MLKVVSYDSKTGQAAHHDEIGKCGYGPNEPRNHICQLMQSYKTVFLNSLVRFFVVFKLFGVSWLELHWLFTGLYKEVLVRIFAC